MGNRRSSLDRDAVIARVARLRVPSGDALIVHLLRAYTTEGARRERGRDRLDVPALFQSLAALASIADVAATYGDVEMRDLALAALREYLDIQ